MKKNDLIFIVALVVLTIALRLIPIFPNNFPFMFDHAKDSLIIMQMGTQFKPSLIGAVTSIPGVYYGPAWYYLALPLNMVMNYHPLASVLTVIILSAISVVFAYKYLGKVAAVWLATSYGLIGTQTSAWSPYLTPLLMVPILIILLQLKSKKPVQLIELLLLAFFTSLSFHFQPAFGVVLVPLVLVILILLKIKVSVKLAALAVIVFLAPFAPHLLFELRHDFHQTKQVINFVQHYSEQANVVQPNQKGLGRFTEINKYGLETFGKAISPIEAPYGLIGVLAIVVLQAIMMWQMKSNKKTLQQVRWTDDEGIIYGTLVAGTLLLYIFLPAKSYYFVALLPVFIVWIARFVEKNFPQYFVHIAAILIVLAFGQASQNYSHFKSLAHTETFMLQPKLDAINKVYELADGKPFVSYQFVPEIYDYQYQHMYRWLGRQGYTLPVEYSYAPQEKAYMEQIVPNLDIPTGSADQIFLIVERPGYEWAFDEWWQRVASGLEIREKRQINDAITVYQATVKR
jgi:hypothetical protein